MAIGRISGPLLKANLLRDGVDLAFETDLIYLDVSDPNPANHRVGIKNSSPSYTFDVTGTTRTTNLIAGLADIDDVNINNNKIKSSVGNLIIEAATLTDRVQIGAANIPNIYGDVRIDGNLHTTGNITADGDIVIGDQDTDSIVFNADVKSNIIPDVTDTYNLGIPAKRWLQVNTNNANIGDLALGTNLIETTQPNQDLYITANGSGQVIINDLFSVGGSSVTFEGTDLTVGNLLLNGDGQHTGVSSIDSNTDFYVGAAGTGQIYLQSNVIAEQDLAVNGGDLTTTATTFNLVNNTATTVNFAGASTTTNIGALTGTTTVGNDLTVNGDVLVKGGDVTTTATTASVFDTTATTVNAFRDGTAITIGATTGTTTIRNANVVLDGDLAVNGGDVITTAATFNLVNNTATTVNFAGAGTAITIGSNTGTLTLRNPTIVGVDTTQNLFNTVATTVNFAGAATDIQIGSANGTTNVNNNLDVDGDVNIDGGDLRTTSPTFNLLNDTATIVNFAGQGELVNIGGETGKTNIKNNLDVDIDVNIDGSNLTTSATEFNLLNTNATTVNFAGAATDVQIGSATGTTNVNNNLDVDGNVNIDGGSLTVSTTTFDLANTTATTVNFAGAATDVQIGSATGTTTINNNLQVDGSANITGDITIGGNIRVGDKDLDTITVVADFTSDLVPDVSNTYNLGTPTKTWNNLFVSALSNGDIIISGNTITTSQSNSNLELDAAGTGTIELKTNSNITGTLGVTQNVTLDSDLAVNGGNLTTTAATFNLVNTDATTVNFAGTATNIQIGAATGTTTIKNENVVLDGDLAVNGGDLTTTSTTFNLLTTNAETVNFADAANTLNIAKLDSTTTIKGMLNVDQQTTLNSVNVEDLTSGRVVLAGTNGELEDSPNLTFNGTLLTVTGDQYITGNLDVDGDVTIGGNIRIGNQTIDTVTVVADFTSDLVPDVADTFSLGTPEQFWRTLYASSFDNGTIVIEGNTITTVESNADIEIGTSGTGYIRLQDNTSVDGDIFVNGTSSTINGITITGTTIDSVDSSGITFTPATTFQSDVTVENNLYVTNRVTADEVEVTGHLIVSGTQTTINSESIILKDGLIYLGEDNPADVIDLGFVTSFTNGTYQHAGFVRDASDGIWKLFKSVEDEPGLTINFDQAEYDKLRLADIEVVNLTENRVVLAGPGGLLVDSGNLTFNGSLLTVTGDQRVTGNLDVDGNIRLGGNIYIGDQPLDTITVVADFTSDLVPQEANKYNLGTAVKAWQNVYAGQVNVSGLQLNSTVISTVDSNADLVLDPAGTGTVYINSDQALKIPVGDTTVRPAGITGQIRFNTDTNQFEGFQGTAWSSLGGVRDVDGNTYIIPEQFAGANDNTLWFYTDGNLSATLDSTRFDTVRLTVDDIAIDGNVIETTNSNSNLELRANGTGYVTFTDTSAIKLPVGTTVERLDGVTGQVRFNTDTTQFEGYNGVAWSSLGGVRDVDGNTYIIPELSSGSNENTLYFYTDGFLTATFDKDYNKFFAAGLQIPTGGDAERPVVAESGSIRFNTDTTQFEGFNGTAWSSLGGVRDVDGNTYIIPELSSGSNENTLYFYTDGKLSATLDKFEFNIYDQIFRNDQIVIDNNRIETYNSNTDLVLAAHGAGVVYIDSTSAIKIPAGTNDERPGGGTLGGAGWIRWNTDINSLEAWNGTIYQPVGGGSSSDANADTRLTFETNGNNEDIIRFYAGVPGLLPGSSLGSNEIMTVSNDGLIVSNTIRIFQNVIENVNTNEDLIIRASGTGRVIIDGTSGSEGSVFVTDPLLTINSGALGNNTYDAGFIFERGDLINKGFIYDETAGEFAAISTIEQGTVKGNVAIADYENVSVASVKLNSETTNKVTFTDSSKIVRTLDNGRVAFVDGVMKFTTNAEVAIPTGTTAERPIAPQEGTIRYNTDQQYFEGFAQGTWQGLGFGAASAPTYQGFVADGFVNEFVLNETPLSAAGIIVAVNGVVQEPEVAYAVNGNILSFLDESSNIATPELGDRIDVRFISKPAVSTVRTTNFTGDGSTTSFDTGYAIDSDETVLVFVNSIYQDMPVYSVSGSVVTFDEAPYQDDRINIVNIAAIVAPNLPTKTYVDQQDTIISNNATDDAIAFAIALG